VPAYTLDPLRDPRWPEFLERHSSASVFHSPEWLDALRRIHGYEPLVYTTSPPRAELANGMVFCRVDSWLTGCRLVSLPFSDHTEPLVDSEETLHDLLGALREDFRTANWKYVEIRPLRSSIGGTQSFEKSSVFYLHRMDLRPSLEVLFRSFHKDCTQRKIRRAEREALTYEAGRSEVLLQKFYELLLLTCRRKQLPPQPIAWFRHLIEGFGDRLTIHVASKDGRPVASILTLSFKRTLVFKYGCSDSTFNRLGGTHFLLWKAIQEAKRQGLHEFDLGRSDFSTPGLVTFKDRWGTTRSVISYFRCSRSPSPSIPMARPMRIAKPFFAHLPDKILIAAGEMLYRHMG
jgi:CelD/BcsL family acetyltransferase involved in cellulose biosynthesis